MVIKPKSTGKSKSAVKSKSASNTKASIKKTSKVKPSKKSIFKQNDLSQLSEGIISNVGVGIYIVQHGKFIFASPLYQRLTGYSAAEIVGHNSLYHVHPDDQEMVRTKAIKCLKSKSLDNYEYRFIKKNGEILWVLEMVTPIVYKGERAGLGSFMDITERKQAESQRETALEALRQSEERYRTILENMQEGYFEVDLAGNFTFFNDATCRVMGYSKEEMTGMNDRQYTDKENAKILFQSFNEVYRTGNPSKAFDWQIISKDGTKRFIEISASLKKDSSGNPIGFRGAARDITERKQAESQREAALEALRQSEEKYRSILENIEDGYYEAALNGKFTFFNDSLCRIFGYPQEELMGMNNRQYADKENAKKIFQTFNEVYKTGNPARGSDWQIIRKDGTKRFGEASVSLIKDSSGNPTGFRGVVRDITERKQTEETIKQSEERYRTILDEMADAYFEVDLAGNYTFVNDACCRHLGYPREELIGASFRGQMAKEEIDKVYKAFNKIFKSGNPEKVISYKVLRKDGTTGFTEMTGFPLENQQRKIIGFRGVGHDITERKLAEEALRQSEERHRTILEDMQEGYFEVDLAGNFTFFNDATCRVMGYSKEEMTGMNDRKYTDKENAKILFQAFNEVYRTGNPCKEFVWQSISKDGTKRFIEISASLKKDSAGNPIGFRGAARDITERKQAESQRAAALEALRHSEEKYRTILENIEDGYYEVDLAGNLTFFNNSMCRIWGYPKEELMGMNSRQYTDKENAKILFQTFNEVYKTGKPAKGFDWHIISKAGTKRYIEASVSLLKDSSDKPIGFRGIVRDVTERKLAEEALRQSEEKYRTILENMQEGYFEVDLAGNFTFFNEAAGRVIGYPIEEMMGLNSRQYTDKAEAKKLFQTFNEVYKTGNPSEAFDWQIINKDGTKRFIEVSVSIRKDSSGKPIGFRGIGHDITERKQAESQREAALEAVRQSEEKYRTILENIEDGYYEVDIAGNFTFFNDSMCRILGYPQEELMGMNSRQYTDKENAKILFQTFTEVYRTGQPARGSDWQIIRKDGTKRFGEASVSLIKDSSGNPIGFRGITRDVTERKQAESQREAALEALRQSEEKYRTILENIEDGYYEVDLNGDFTFFNDSTCLLLGYSQEEMIGMNNRQYTDRENSKILFQAFNEVYRTGEPAKEFAWQIIRKDGTKRFLESSISLIKDSSGNPIGFRGVTHDVTERKQAEEKIQHMATHDALTGLPNRFMFTQLLNHALQTAKRYQKQCAVLFMDLDRFKIINDTMGHEAGDLLLQEVAARLKQTLRAVDLIARLGGDEFVILVEEVSNLKQLETVANKILSTVIKPMSIFGEECRVTGSIGISVFPNDADDEQTLMKNADIAMYFAKEEGKNNFQFYSADIKPLSIERLSIESNLRYALERNEFALAYQAKLDFKTNVITGVEALLRWNNPALGSVTPTQFIPVAEETGLIVPIGRWVLRTACAQNVAWQQQGLPPVCMAVNLSLRQLTDDNLIDDIRTALNDSGMAPNLLELEITERMVMHNPERVIGTLTKIKNMGVRFALDDFGTGYSSLAQIKHFPIDTLKVDRSFIRNIPIDIEDKAITKAIIAMGKTLSLTVVAEGVETQEQMDFLREHSCDEMQGYYFSKPIAPEQFAELLGKHNPSLPKVKIKKMTNGGS